MTKDDQVEDHYFEAIGLPFSDTQQQEKPFHVVLVDIKKTIEEGKSHCVEKPLEEDDLKYIALSYRWGELEETLVDTELGYIASITSFKMDDFIGLCKIIKLESDLKDMDYLWVDAICVDQTNYERRKATIHQMSAIYEHASYILAVPDLHLQHLKDINTRNAEIIKKASNQSMYIYNLIHGNKEQLTADDEAFMDKEEVPVEARQWLIQHTDYFTQGFMEYRLHCLGYDCEQALDHIYQVSQASRRDPKIYIQKQPSHSYTNGVSNNNNSLAAPKDCHCEETDCPLQGSQLSYSERKKFAVKDRQWKQEIIRRSNVIRQSMEFLQSLIVDWSSRVWVISEYNIAKKKNNLKYWFIQVSSERSFMLFEHLNDFKFFKFDFYNDMDPSRLVSVSHFSGLSARGIPIMSDAIYPKFHQSMATQLKKRTFLEMLLKSKASKCEDRFYAVLPLSKYKDKFISQSLVDKSCQVTSMTSVKLKLFEWMDTKDKLNLLFLTASNMPSSLHGHMLPTFATTNLNWEPNFEIENVSSRFDSAGAFNFDLRHPSTTLVLHRHQTTTEDNDVGRLDGKSNLYFLNLKPKEYFLFPRSHVDINIKNNRLSRSLHLDGPDDILDLVKISSVTAGTAILFDFSIYLLGNFEKNKWILAATPPKDSNVITNAKCQ
ncbi:unnamed protein product [Absidia cylindrospora]